MNGPLLPRPRFWAEAALQKKTRYTLLGELLTFLIVFFVASIVQTLLVMAATVVWLLGSGSDLIMKLSAETDLSVIVETTLNSLPDWLMFLTLFTYAVFGAAAILYCRKFEKRSLASMGLRRKGALREYGLGGLVGLLLVLAVVGVGAAAKGFRVGSSTLRASALPLLLLTALGYAVQAAALELMCRGYLATSLGTRAPIPLTVAFSALIPTLFISQMSTLTTIGFINALLLAVLLIVYMIKRGNLWGVCGLHAMWDIGLHLLFDFIEEGSPGELTVFPVYTVPSNAVISGSAFGPEASICSTIALLAGIAVVLALKPKDPIAPEPEQETEEAL